MPELNHVPANRGQTFFANVWRTIHGYLASVKLAIVLLIIILVSCFVGVTVFRGAHAGAVIFSTLWFNGILVLLVVNVAFCFFPRMWGRKLTLVSFGMILFHLSFVAMLGGIVYNSLIYFHGMIRLTEGETLPSSNPESYDFAEHGRYFDFAKLKGETTLMRVRRNYEVGGEDKQVAYEVAVGDGGAKKRGIIYITHKLENRGFEYFCDREGYSLLVLLYDKKGKELYGAHVPLQSYKQKDESYLYSTGVRESPESFPFPHNPQKPLFALQVTYIPSPSKERAGDALFQTWPLSVPGSGSGARPVGEAKAPIGKKGDVGSYYLSAAEVRYWAAMTVRYDPGKPIVLTSLWVGLGGMVLTFFGRMRQSKAS